MTLSSLWNSSNQGASTARPGRLRRIWVNIHLCIGLGLAVLLIPISLTGAALVWHEPLEAMLHPARRAVTQGAPQSLAALLAGARSALGDGYAVVGIRMPDGAGAPAAVTAREQRRGEGRGGGRPRQDARPLPDGKR